MYCPYCGTQSASDTKFCPNCGASLAEENTQNTQNSYEQPVYSQPESNPNSYADYQPAYQTDNSNGKGFAIASLVCGILSLFCFAFILGTLGIIFGCVARSKGYKGAMSIAGIICGAIGIILWILMLVGGSMFILNI